MEAQDSAKAGQWSTTIAALDLTPIIDRIVTVHRWPRNQAEMAARQYKNYLFLKKKYPHEALPPSQEIDELWHCHILHTRKYMADCEAIFGCYLHHEPSHQVSPVENGENLQNLFEQKTQALHFEEFGEYLYEVRTYPLLARLANYAQSRLRRIIR